MSKYTFLTEEQCFEDIILSKEQLDIFKEKGTKAKITDFAVALGGFISSSHVDSDTSLKGRTGYYWTKSDDGDNDVRVVSNNGHRQYLNVSIRYGGARPALPFSSIYTIPTNGVSGEYETDKDGVKFVYDGYYPQTAPEKDIQAELNKLYEDSEWNRKNIIPEVCEVPDIIDYKSKTIKYKKIDGYWHNGKIYVRKEMKKGKKLSNGEEYSEGEPVWFEVEPIKRWISKQGKITITEKIIFAGVPFDFTEDYKTENFEKTVIYKFTNDIWARDVERLKSIIKGKDFSAGLETSDSKLGKTRKTRLQKLNPDTTPKEEKRKMTDTEILHDWIESGESVVIIGPSGIGKTERIKSLYPNLIYLKLTNNMFPEKVVGSTNLQTGQNIPPDYAKEAILEEATEEERRIVEENIQKIYEIADTVYERSKQSDKKIVILLDELLNVKPTVQTLVYTLVLNKFVEIGKGLKLPDNVVVVATGNPKKYSKAAEDLAEPLQKRFHHIKYLEPKVGEWLIEYAIPNKVHSSVIGYILSKYIEHNRSERIEDIRYFYEEPEVGEKNLNKYGCTGITNDPRQWTIISQNLYNFEENLKKGKYAGTDVEYALKENLESRLRMCWAQEFYDYYNQPTLTPEEVVKGIKSKENQEDYGYTQEDLPRDINERFAYMLALVTANEKQVEACREFIRKYCDPEYLSIYEIYWAGNDERRMEKISELQEMELQFKLHRGEEAQPCAKDGVEAYRDIGVAYRKALKLEKLVTTR